MNVHGQDSIPLLGALCIDALAAPPRALEQRVPAKVEDLAGRGDAGEDEGTLAEEEVGRGRSVEARE